MDEKGLKELLRTNKLEKIIAQYNKLYSQFTIEIKNTFLCKYAKHCQKENCHEGMNHRHQENQKACFIIPEKHGCPAEYFKDNRYDLISPCAEKNTINLREGDRVVFIHNPDSYTIHEANPIVCTKHFQIGTIAKTAKTSTAVKWDNDTTNYYSGYRHLEYWQVLKRTLLNTFEINMLYSISTLTSKP